MPLTIAHPAAVMPLRHTGLPFSALVVGSIAPDLEYLFHLSPTGHIGHTIPGLLIFCVPVSLVSLLIYHRIWAPAANSLMNRSGDEFRFFPLSQFGLICLAIIIGAFSHLAWDSFTHSYGWMVQRVPILRTPIWESSWGTLRLFKILQHSSTSIGLIILGFEARPSLRAFSAQLWGTVAILVSTSIVGGAVIGYAKAGMPADFNAVRVLIGIAIVGAFAVFAIEATVAGVVWRARK